MPDLSSIIPFITAGTSLASTGSGLYQNYENQKYQDMLRSLASNPQKLGAYAQGFTQPLQAGLVQGVNNQAQAYAAERGLSSSPQLEQSIENQAIAPYIQQNQQQGFANALQALGLGGGAAPNAGANPASLGTGLSGLLSLLSGKGALTNLQNEAASAGAPATYDDPTSSTIAPVPTPTLDMTGFGFGG